MTAPSFSENGRCFDKIWAGEKMFFVKNWKKGASFRLFWPILKCSFKRSYPFFGPNMGMTAEGLACKIRKK